MATKKTTTDEIIEASVETLDPWEKVELRTERGLSTDDPNEFISINGVNYILPKGKVVEVPRCVADEYHRMLEAKDAFFARCDELLKNSAIQ